MPKRRLKYKGRCKAPFGSETAAILTAAGINAATQMAAAGIRFQTVPHSEALSARGNKRW